MLLNEPQPTGYDLNFSLFGFPIRVHPGFAVLPLLLGGRNIQLLEMNAGVALILLLVIFFVSVLVHELGHALAFRYYGIPSRIVLYWFGGLAIPDAGGQPWMPQRQSLTAQQQIVVSLAGPFAGFLLAGVVLGVLLTMGGSTVFRFDGIVPMWFPRLPAWIGEGPMVEPLWLLFLMGIWVNIFLNVLNLAPVYPLDGGQVARQLFVMNDPWNGVRYSIILSIAVAGLIALTSFTRDDRFMGFFFAVFAISNYMTLQQTGTGFGGGRPW